MLAFGHNTVIGSNLFKLWSGEQPGHTTNWWLPFLVNIFSCKGSIFSHFEERISNFHNFCCWVVKNGGISSKSCWTIDVSCYSAERGLLFAHFRSCSIKQSFLTVQRRGQFFIRVLCQNLSFYISEENIPEVILTLGGGEFRNPFPSIIYSASCLKLKWRLRQNYPQHYVIYKPDNWNISAVIN